MRAITTIIRTVSNTCRFAGSIVKSACRFGIRWMGLSVTILYRGFFIFAIFSLFMGVASTLSTIVGMAFFYTVRGLIEDVQSDFEVSYH